ncbi:cytochrome c3 family protein [Desulfovibrionales bacterium]
MRHKFNGYVIFCSVVLCVTFGSIAAFAQDTGVFKLDFFGTLERPVSAFDHDGHQEMEGMECSDCHHVYENGVKAADQSSEDQACSDCHKLKAQGSQPGLRMAYHQQCKNCHVEKKAGPVACGACHVK